jgi:hypothetical protein
MFRRSKIRATGRCARARRAPRRDGASPLSSSSLTETFSLNTIKRLYQQRREEARKKRDSLILAIGADIPEGAQRDAALAAVPTADDLEADYIGDVERRLAVAEEAQHIAEVPNPKKRKTKTTQRRPGSSKGNGQRDRELRQREDEEAEQEGDEALETGLDPKARRKAANKAAKKPRKKPGKPPAAKRSRQDEDEDEDDEDDEDDNDDDDEDVFSRGRGRGRGNSKPNEPMVFSRDDENDDVDEENGGEDEENDGEDEVDEMLREVEGGVDEESGARPA